LNGVPTITESNKDIRRISDQCDLPRPYKKDSKKHNFKMNYKNIGDSPSTRSVNLGIGDKSLQK